MMNRELEPAWESVKVDPWKTFPEGWYQVLGFVEGHCSRQGSVQTVHSQTFLPEGTR